MFPLKNLARKGLTTNNNITLGLLELMIISAKKKHLEPQKKLNSTVMDTKMNKWTTLGIINSIEFRDNQYKKLDLQIQTMIHQTLLENLQNYNIIFQENIKAAKRIYYINMFKTYITNVRKMNYYKWNT